MVVEKMLVVRWQMLPDINIMLADDSILRCCQTDSLRLKFCQHNHEQLSRHSVNIESFVGHLNDGDSLFVD